jgi:hypothetical protein
VNTKHTVNQSNTSDDTLTDASVSTVMRQLREESEEWSDYERAWFRHPIGILDVDA